MPKWDIERTIPLFPVAKKAVERMLTRNPAGEDEMIFRGARGGLINKNYVSEQFRYYRDYTGENDEYEKLSSDYHLHTLRHTFASWLRIDGVPLDRIKEWMGHSSITTTEKYAHLTPDHIAHEGKESFAQVLF